MYNAQILLIAKHVCLVQQYFLFNYITGLGRRRI